MPEALRQQALVSWVGAVNIGLQIGADSVKAG